jgi:hypothetical protein
VNETDWGVVSANYVRANGTVVSSTLQNGIMPTFGSNVLPQGGSSLFVLSSGRARTPGQPSACGSATCTGFGAGTPPSTAYPQNAPGCPISEDINDDVGLELTLRGADERDWVQIRVQVLLLRIPRLHLRSVQRPVHGAGQPGAGALDGNISFDSTGAPVSVNVAFFTVCNGCPDGEGDMVNTGFDSWRGSFDDGEAGGTIWLQTQARPVEGGSTFTIRFGIWDTGDSALDSTAVIDNFEWIAEGGTVTVGTEPIPE